MAAIGGWSITRILALADPGWCGCGVGAAMSAHHRFGGEAARDDYVPIRGWDKKAVRPLLECVARHAPRTEGRTKLVVRPSLARRREMWPTWSASPSENARRQSLSVSVTRGEAVVQQGDPDHTAPRGLARAWRRRRTGERLVRDRVAIFVCAHAKN